MFGGKIAAVYARTSQQLQAEIDLPTIEAGLAALTTNRLSFAVPDLGLFFDGQLADDTIDGLLTSAGVFDFSVERERPADGSPIAASPLYLGNWNGAIDLGTGQSTPMSVTFAATAGTLTLPELGIGPVPVSGLAFDVERPIGRRLSDQAMPLSREQSTYWARYVWGDRTLGLAVTISSGETLEAMQVAPEPQLVPDPMAGYVSTATYQLPFDGLWWVYWGGDRPLENYHTIDRRQRHAADLLIWNDGATHRTDGARNADYWIWGQPVLAPAAGTVVEVLDGVAENTPGSPTPGAHPAGNHVMLQTAPEEFLLLAHLQPGTIRVASGDRVAAGQAIGLVGNSGNSFEPHLHIHLQNEADFFSPTANGLPLVFRDAMVNGTRNQQVALAQGAFVSPA